MIVGACKFNIELFEVLSAKEKHSIVARIKQKVFNQFKVQISEVDALENQQLAILGFALAGSESNYVRSLIEKMMNYVEESEGLKIVYDKVEVLEF